jgi:hypothetical protein
LVFSFKNGKAPDDSKVTSEHLKYGGQKLFTVLTMLIHFIFQNKHIPPILKSEIACPIYEKGGKLADNPNSLRHFVFYRYFEYFYISVAFLSVSRSDW